MYYKNILDAIGHTPIIKLNKITDETMANIYVKLEMLNIGGSIKTRTSYNMLKTALKENKINQNTTICEPTSGNQGIGLALICAYLGLKCIIIMPDSVSIERRKLIKHYGAKLELVHDNNNIGECIEKCIQLAKQMQRDNENFFIPNQFSNFANSQIHEMQTGAEIIEDLPVTIDAFCSGIGTGGTISGISHALKEKYPSCKIYALEPENAAILSHMPITSHEQMGIGDGVIPEILDQNIIDEIMLISDKDAIRTSQLLAQKEGIAGGITSGTNVYAAIKIAKILGPGKNVVTILPDTAERYYSTNLFKEN